MGLKKEKQMVEQYMAKYYGLITEKPSAWLGHGKFALSIQFALKPKVVVDLGVDYGFSTFIFGMLRIGKVYGIDSFDGDIHAGYHSDAYNHVMRIHKIIQKEMKNYSVEIIKGYFDDVAQSWNKPIDILHIDGLHTYEAVKNDYETWGKFVTANGIIMMHDTHSYPNDVGRFFNELEEPYKFCFEHSAGLGVICKSEKAFRSIQPYIKFL